MQQLSQDFSFGLSQRHQQRLDCGKTPIQQLLADVRTLLGEVERDGPLVAAITTLNQIVGDKSIHEADRSRMGQAKNAPQLVVGRAEAVSDDDQRSRRFTGAVEDGSRCLFNSVSDGKPDSAEQVGGAVDHPGVVCAPRTFFNLTMCALRTYLGADPSFQAAESTMAETPATSLTREHMDFYERFKTFWSSPSGPRVAELIAPDATIHFTGAGAFSGTEYIDAMQGMLASFVDLKVTPLDCAGEGDRLYIFWESSAVIDGARRTWKGVDRFRLAGGMAIEEHVIFDSAVLQPAS